MSPLLKTFRACSARNAVLAVGTLGEAGHLHTKSDGLGAASHEEGGKTSHSRNEQCNTGRGGWGYGRSVGVSVPEPGWFGAWKLGFFLWEVTVLRLGGGSPQTCRQCVLGVTGNSEVDRCCEVSFCILDKAQRSLSWAGRRGPGSRHIALDHRGK